MTAPCSYGAFNITLSKITSFLVGAGGQHRLNVETERRPFPIFIIVVSRSVPAWPNCTARPNTRALPKLGLEKAVKLSKHLIRFHRGGMRAAPIAVGVYRGDTGATIETAPFLGERRVDFSPSCSAVTRPPFLAALSLVSQESAPRSHFTLVRFASCRAPPASASKGWPRAQITFLRPTSWLKKFMPVALPSGRAKLATRPSWTGSSATPKTIGIVAVAALAAIVPGVLPGVAITATRRRTRSATLAGKLSYWPSSHWYSTFTFWPST